MRLPRGIAKVERISLQPGDRLVLTADRRLDDEEFQVLCERTRAWVRSLGLPDGGVIVLEAGVSLQVLEAVAVNA